MADIWLGRINRALEKLFNVKGGPTIVDLSPSLQVVDILGDNVEERYLQSWGRYWQLANLTANAANTGGSQLRNPAGSNVVLVVEKVALGNGVNSTTTVTRYSVSAGTAAADLTGSSAPGFRMDPRQNPNSVGILSVQNTSPSNLPTIVHQPTATALFSDLILEDDQEWTILPGDAIRIISQTANEAELMHWIWRERALESSELT